MTARLPNSEEPPDPERRRLLEVPTGRAPWRHWGPYLSERAWGTVREDYSPDGDAWHYFPHDQARSRAYRWNEDGLAGICDDRQTLCLALAFWNGRDPILKERIFGLSGPEGNHGEDAKEYWWYLDSTPTHSWMRWRYMYPQAEFPYEALVAESARRSRLDPEFELVDTGVFDDGRYWEITSEFAKASPEDVCLRISLRNHGPEAAWLDVLPTLWFRNTWSWQEGAARPAIRPRGSGLVAEHPVLGRRHLTGSDAPRPLFCENETNGSRIWGGGGPDFPKDGINDHVIHGRDTVNPALEGTKAALHYRLQVEAGGVAEVRLRLAEHDADLGTGFQQVMQERQSEADAFYARLLPSGTSADEAAVMRQAYAGMLWSKQFYHYDVERWLDGDATEPPPPPQRLSGRNAEWRNLNNLDVLSMPDKWEYPWYASWDLAFHCVTLAHLDPEFAKSQLILLCREWYMHPNGQLPAYEWAFGDVNPPVHAWAAARVFAIDGYRDYEFLERVFHKLLLNFTWWVNRKDAGGNNVFQGGFLGLDNIGPFDRSAALPVAGHLEQSDGTAWMAMYCLSLLELALWLASHDDTYEDIATKFFEHFTLIALAMNDHGLWDEQDGFYYDVLSLADGTEVPLRARSMVGLVPIFAVTVLEPSLLERLHDFRARSDWYVHNKPEVARVVAHAHQPHREGRRLLSVVGPDRLKRILARMLDENEFLSPGGIRALSRFHSEHPLQTSIAGSVVATVDYEPGESTSGLFGGNSNWRGPVWFPVNYLVIGGLVRFHDYLGEEFKVECPTGSGRLMTLLEVAHEIQRRLIGLFLDSNGRRPVFGSQELFQKDASWRGLIPFHEYFHGDTGAGLGASHQTGWTGLVADMISHPLIGEQHAYRRPGRPH